MIPSGFTKVDNSEKQVQPELTPTPTFVSAPPAFWTAARARRSRAANPPSQQLLLPRLRLSPLVAAAGKSSQRARSVQSSQLARDVWAAPAKQRAAAPCAAVDPEAPNDSAGALVSAARARQPAPSRGRPARPLPPVGFERLLVDIGFNVLELDQLIGVASSRITETSFSHGPSNLNSVIQRSDSYFGHIPARYGYTPCLDDAIRCIAIKVKRILSPASFADNSCLPDLYGRALQSLQSAIKGNTWSDPKVLCAAELISVYEVSKPLAGCYWFIS
jgi:hypothetical protein